LAAYWKSGVSESQSNSESQGISAAHPPLPDSKSKPPSSKASRPAAKTTGRRKRAPTIDEDELESIDINVGEDIDDEMDDDDEPPAPARTPRSTRSKTNKTTSPAKPKKPASKTTKTTATAATKTKPKAKASTMRKGKGKQPALFLSDPSDEEGMAVDDDDYAETADLDVSNTGDTALVSELVGDDRETAMTSTLRSTAGTQVRRAAARTAKRPVALVDLGDDDSDDAVFKGFGGRKRGRIG